MTDRADAERWLAADRTNSWELAQVIAIAPDTSDSVTLRLRLPEPTEIEAGQYYLIRVALDSPSGSVQQAYSLSAAPDPASDEIEITVREVTGGRASPHLVRDVQIGDVLQLRGPFGFLTRTDAEGPLGLIGAGSGVAPLVSLVDDATRRHADTRITMLCSSRDRSSILLRRRLEDLGRTHHGFDLVHTFTRSPDDLSATYHRRIDAAMLTDVMDAEDGLLTAGSFYVAGPGQMVLSVQELLVALGVPEDRIVTEDHA